MALPLKALVRMQSFTFHHHPLLLLKPHSFQVHQFHWRENPAGQLELLIQPQPAGSGVQKEHNILANSDFISAEGVNAGAAPALSDSFDNIIM